ncbi:MAG: hypothetical protein KatS3mg105_1554 [Gemmatales bacterium]|nr:MAG: hypothetical protein KatS3mg105_1554 [Gemmatales bacterium]
MDAVLHLIDRLRLTAQNLQIEAAAKAKCSCWCQLVNATEAGLAGERLLEQKQYRRARRHLAAALGQFPQQPRLHYLYGRSLVRGNRRRWYVAEAHLRKSLELDPYQADCTADLGWLCLRNGRPKEAETLLRHSVKLAPGDASILRKAVRGLCRLGLVADAQDVLRQAVRRFPQAGELRHLWRQFMYWRLFDRQQSVRDALRNDDGDPMCLPFPKPPLSNRRATGQRRADEG